ncbi:MAG: fibronectin type III domain-containing protein [Thermodesulfobacteriota bacterium]
MAGRTGAIGRPLAVLLAVALAGGLVGCGKKTRPVPPDMILPAPITDLSYRLDEKGVHLNWSCPTRTVQDDRLPYVIEGFELWRAVVALKDDCPGCPIPFGPPVELAAECEGGKAQYQETLLRPGYRYVYRVRSKAGWYVASDDSNTVSVVWDTPLAAPTGLSVSEDDRLLTLRWQAPAGLLDGGKVSDPLRYQVYRSVNGADFVELGEPVGSLEYADREVRNGKRYFYRVRAVRLHHGVEAAGMVSATVAGSPRDLTPPAPPRQVGVNAVSGGVRLFWEAVPEADLAGFRVYRRAGQAGKPEKIAEIGGATLSYVDHPPAGKGAWFYSVSSFDRSRNESPRSMEAVLEPRE